MMKVAAKAASVDKYILTDQDCLTVPLSAVNELRNLRGGYGNQTSRVPNTWRFFLPATIGLTNFYLPSNREIKYK